MVAGSGLSVWSCAVIGRAREVDLEPFVGRDDLGTAERGRAIAGPHGDAIELVVAVGGIVVEQHELLGARLAGDVHRVVDGRVAPVPLRLVLLGRVLRVVDQQVDAVAELEDVVRHVVVGIVGAAARARGRGRRRPTGRPTRRGSRASARRGARTATAPWRGRSGNRRRRCRGSARRALSPSGRIGKNGGHMSPREHLAERRRRPGAGRGRRASTPGCATARRTAGPARGPSAGA